MMTALKLINCGAIREPGVISRCFDICMGRCMQRPIQGKLHILYSALFVYPSSRPLVMKLRIRSQKQPQNSWPKCLVFCEYRCRVRSVYFKVSM